MNQSLQSIAAWLLAALTHWTPMPAGKLADSVNHEREIVAQALVDVAYDPAEPPLPTFANGNDSRAQTALLLGSIAAHESNLLPRLALDQCLPGECDGGHAVGLTQIHIGRYGVNLLPGAGFRYCGAHYADCVTRADLVGNEQLQVRTALHWLRQGGLSRFTGEASEDAPKARKRKMSAMLWYARHPPPTVDATTASL